MRKNKFERIRRITGYLVGTTDRFNNAKRAEGEAGEARVEADLNVSAKVYERSPMRFRLSGCQRQCGRPAAAGDVYGSCIVLGCH